MSIEAAKWEGALRALGFTTFTVAGEGPADYVLEGLAIGAPEPPSGTEMAAALSGADLVVVENVCSLPLNVPAARLLARALRSRRAILRHHDLPWQREQFAGFSGPVDDEAWVHVTINELSRRQLADRGIAATTVYNAFYPDPAPGERTATREALGVGVGERLLLQPTRALERKNIPGGLELAEALNAVYWLLGPPEDGYGPQLERLFAHAPVRVVHGPPPSATPASPANVLDLYAASDAVLLPSTWEGFGNPALESAACSRPLAIAPYPVARELAAFGFRWFDLGAHGELDGFLRRPDERLLAWNKEIVRRHFSLADLPARIARVIEDAGWHHW